MYGIFVKYFLPLFLFLLHIAYTLFHRYDPRALVCSDKYIVWQPQLENIIVADLKCVPLGKDHSRGKCVFSLPSIILRFFFCNVNCSLMWL